jgi:hypothetical protein
MECADLQPYDKGFGLPPNRPVYNFPTGVEIDIQPTRPDIENVSPQLPDICVTLIVPDSCSKLCLNSGPQYPLSMNH